MRRTKIVCTIGPASREPEVLKSLILAGMNVARLNLSHGDQDYHSENIKQVRAVAAAVGKPVAILIDLQGPKLRVGHIPGEGVLLQEGGALTLTIEDVPTTPERAPVQFKGLPAAVRAGDRILVDDGLLELAVEGVDEANVFCRVVTGGLLKANKGMNLPQADLSIPAITEKDLDDLRFALEHRADWIALSFVRRAEEVIKLKQMIRHSSQFDRATPVVAKIEKPEAFKNIDDIIAAADGIMVARGDLGIETSPEAVPMMQKMIIAKCNRAGTPVITATQMLDSMMRNPRPTRAEASDVANAILDGADAIMLSGETAVGKYPLRAVGVMVRIAEEVERSLHRDYSLSPIVGPCSITEAVCHAATDTVYMLNASAIIAPTVSGHTARKLARFRPPCPIVAVTPSPIVQQELTLYWGVYPLLSGRAADTDMVIADAVQEALKAGVISEGQTVVVTAGAAGSAPGVTDLIKVHTLARTLAQGQGIGSRKVVGRVRRLDGPLTEDVQVAHDDIVLTPRTDRSFIRVLRQAAGLISAEGGSSSHSFLLAIDLGLPAILGAEDALDTLREGQWVVLDAQRGIVEERLGMRGNDES